MKIAVCTKQILDPEVSPSDFALDPSGMGALEANVPRVVDTFCENALELAIQLKERSGAGEVTAITVGPESSEEVLRKALAMGVDHACRVEWDRSGYTDPRITATVLAKTIEKTGPFDLLLCGREAGDWNSGQVGAFLAEMLGMPSVSFVDQVEASGDKLLLRRQLDNGWEKLEAQTPVLGTVTNHEDNVPRIPKTRNVMKAYRKPVTNFSLSDLGVSMDQVSAGCRLSELSLPQAREACELIEGENAEEKARILVEKLGELKLL